MGCGAEDRLADGFKGRFIESVPATLFYGRAHQPAFRVNRQFHEYLSFDAFTSRQPWITWGWRLEEFRAIHSVE